MKPAHFYFFLSSVFFLLLVWKGFQITQQFKEISSFFRQRKENEQISGDFFEMERIMKEKRPVHQFWIVESYVAYQGLLPALNIQENYSDREGLKTWLPYLEFLQRSYQMNKENKSELLIDLPHSH